MHVDTLYGILCMWDFTSDSGLKTFIFAFVVVFFINNTIPCLITFYDIHTNFKFYLTFYS